MKAAMGWGLSLVPGGRRLHAIVQRKVTHTLPLPDRNFDDRCQIALQHVRALRLHLGTSLDRVQLFEFGAGWDLIIPQLFRACGARRQQVFDLNPLARLDLIANANARLRARETLSANPVTTGGTALPFNGASPLPAEPIAADLKSLPAVAGLDLPTALRTLGIEYVAPGDAANTGLADGAIDAATSSLVLEHVPPEAIRAIFRELHRIVRPGGVVSSTIDPSDHYSHGDSRISPWNFLTYDTRSWDAMNPPLLYQNRLRASEHVDIIAEAGFRVVEVHPTLGGTEDLFNEIRPRFVSPYADWPDPDDLRTTRVQVVAIRD